MGLEPAELARWTRFAAKGGIGKCTATCDCVAESSDDLMFLKDDEITVLLQLQDKEGCYLGYCEGVVGRFSGSDVVFHSKLKKPVMTKRASTNTILSTHSTLNIPYSPTPATPTTPTSAENSAARSSSRRMTDELLTVIGGGRSPSQNSLGHVSPSNSTTSSPVPDGPHASTGTRNMIQNARRIGVLQYGTTSPREFHHGITATNGVSEEDSAESYSPQVIDSVGEVSTTTFTHLSTLSNSVLLTSPSTPPPVPLALESLQPSSPNGKEDISASLRPSGSLVNDHDPTALTAPLRIIKRSPSSPTSPAQSSPATGSLSSPNAPSSIALTHESVDSSLTTSNVFDDMAHTTEPITNSPPPLWDIPSPLNQTDLISALPLSLDTSMTAESAFDDLTTNHPGRFSRFSIGGALTIPQLLGMTSRNTTHISAKNEPQDKPVTIFRPPSFSKPDGRTSLSIAARGKVDEATLASTQAQVGIGLSLLQDLVGGMSSDSDSDSDYDDLDEEAAEEAKGGGEAERIWKSEQNGHSVGIVKTVNSSRSSATPSEGSTVQGLTYADEEDEPQTSTTKNDANKETPSPANTSLDSPTSPILRSPPTTSPDRHQPPQLRSRYTQSPDSFGLPDALDRERRPSLATSVVSGLSGKSGRSGSWDGDIYDNYRYSTFSVGSSMTGAGRPSMDSVRSRTNSVGVAGRGRLESIGLIEDVAEEAESAGVSGVENQLSHANASQDSRLSALSRVIASLSSANSRPSPLSIADDHSPLLHTDWASPSSPAASSVQTALPPVTAGVYTPHLRENDAVSVPKIGISQIGIAETKDEEIEVTGMASTMRKRLEAECRSPTSHSSQTEDIEVNSVSFSSAGLGEDIVVDDDEEIPSGILANADNERYDNDDTILDSHDGHATVVGSPESKDLGDNVSRDQTRLGPESPSPRTSFGRLAPLFVSNRTPSPGMLSQDDEGDTQARSISALSGVSNSPPPPPYRIQAPPFQQSSLPQPPSEPTTPHRRPTNSNTEQERRSLFLPHPNAPKAPVNAVPNLEPGAGVGLVSSAYLPQDDPGGVPPIPLAHMRPPVQVVMRMALRMPPRTTVTGPGKPPAQILPTIYGRTEIDLASSDRPVAIIFSVDPPPNAGGGKATAPHGVLPQIGAGGQNLNGPIATNYHGSPPRRPSTTPASTHGPSLLMKSGVPRLISSSVPQPVQLSLGSEDKDKPALDSTRAQTPDTTVDTEQMKASPSKGLSPLPRSNFTPKAPGLRPRSRSFSGFNSSEPRATRPTGVEKHESIIIWPKRTSSSALVPPGLKHLAKPSRPSPLSVSAVTSSDDSFKPPSSPAILGSAPTSPLARNMFVPPRGQSPPSATIATPSSPATGVMDSFLDIKVSRSTWTDAPQPGNTAVPGATLRSASITTNQMVATSIIGSKPPFEGTTRQTTLPTGIGLGRQSSLRSKLSLPTLRKNRTRDDDAFGVYDRDAAEGRSDRPKEMMQVKDMEFELVRPNLPLLQASRRTSEDSISGRPDNASESRVDTGLLRSESPAVSFNSSDYRSPVVEMQSSVNSSGLNLDAGTPSIGQSSESIEAHRQRETKWVSLMSSSPASLSRKSKKVKKLLVDGVPSSVRYLIWSYLTDGKGRAVKGVYEQLCQRGEVVRTRDIVADAERFFGADTTSDGMQYLQATKGAVIVLLQAYFSMVPDVQYTTGLTKIVGQLLLLAPEEDAFWIFTSIMDTHIRSYFTITAPVPSSVPIPVPRSTQIEVDAALYSRALEAIDSAVAKKMFVDLGILPGVLCHPWFTSLFVGTLPPECTNRVWDIFLYEGVPFLYRIALTLTVICRRFILAPTTTSESMVLATLAHPPPRWLPPTPEAFLTLAFGIKLKDDDIRKQRIKMGEMVKRQTQAQQAPNSVTPSGISLPSFSRS